jgi:hypothetical protein
MEWNNKYVSKLIKWRLQEHIMNQWNQVSEKMNKIEKHWANKNMKRQDENYCDQRWKS